MKSSLTKLRVTFQDETADDVVTKSRAGVVRGHSQ